MFGESNNLLRIFNEKGKLLCWLNLNHPLPLKWNLKIELFSFWEQILVDAIKLISHLNFRIKHKKSRFRRRMQIKSILLNLEEKYLGQIPKSISTYSRRSEGLTYLSSATTESDKNLTPNNLNKDILFSEISDPLNRRKSVLTLKKLTFGNNDISKTSNLICNSNTPKNHFLPLSMIQRKKSVTPKKRVKQLPTPKNESK
jgi:hypothetical protein